MDRDAIRLLIDEPLRGFLPIRHRGGEIEVRLDGTSTLGHLVQSVGVPLTEVGPLLIGARAVTPGHRPSGGEEVRVSARPRPQRLPAAGARFVLDGHLGSLARRLRLLGLDAWYAREVDDDDLVARAVAEDRVLLTKDRGLLRRRALRHAAYVRGSRADEQLADVLDRFAPPIAPFSRCVACNGQLEPVPKAAVAETLQPGTARTYDDFSRCQACGRAYWRGAHARRLEAVVAAAETAAAAARRRARPAR